QAKVLDFGIAKVRSKEKETLETGTGLLLGTPLYMPPEQAMSRGAEPRSDLYSLGVVLFEMLLGTPPFAANTVFEVLLAHREKPIPAFPPEYAIPPALEAVVVRAMAKEPEQRFADAAEMAHALRDAVPMGTGSEANQPGTSPGARMPMSPSMMAMRTPLPGAVRQSGPGLLNAAVQAPSGQTPLPPGVRRSGVVDPAAVAAASQAGLDRTSMRGSRPGLQPLSQSPEFAATHAQAGSSDPLSLPAETAGTMLRATPRPVVPAKTSPHAVQGSGQGPSVIVASDPNLEAPRRARTGLGLVVGLVGLLVLGGGGAGAWWFLKSRGDDAVINGVKGIPIADPTPGPQPIKPPPPPEAPSSPARPEEPVKRPPAEQQVAAAGPDASVEGVATNVEPPAKAPLPDSASPAQQPATKLPGLAKPNRPARPTVGATRPGRGDAAKPGAGTKVKEGGYEVTSF
ncbi:MAG: protein kinase, partial [Deltaproteobacteria bacterium]|nr:protein kinase [Deltaproteobacteria bacterium]